MGVPSPPGLTVATYFESRMHDAVVDGRVVWRIGLRTNAGAAALEKTCSRRHQGVWWSSVAFQLAYADGRATDAPMTLFRSTVAEGIAAVPPTRCLVGILLRIA